MSDWYPPPSRPRRVDGGLKARSARGQIAKTWWSQRFIQVLETFNMGGRLLRGRAYARQGQVISLEVSAGQVLAQVQGSRSRPYGVRIGITAFDKRQWSEVEAALVENAWYTAALLAAEMPADIEDLFESVKLSLFPTRSADLSMDCTCPDGAVPCKHLAATFYLLAELFDEDPFQILAWRGRAREDLLKNLAAARSDSGVAADRGVTMGPPLSDCLDSFFQRQGDLPPPTPPVTSPTALLDQLPEVAVSVRGRPLAEVLRPAYDLLGGDA